MAVKKSQFTPWSYHKGSSKLHRLPAGIKLAFLFLLSLAAFFPGSPGVNLALLSLIVLILIVLSFASGLGPLRLLRGSGPLFIVVLGVFLFQAFEFSPPGINLEGLRETAIFCVRIASAFAAGTLLFALTTAGEIRKSLSRLEAVLHLEKLRLGLGLSLMLGFLPRFFEIWEDVNLAWKSRGGGNKLSRPVTLIPLAVEKMMIKAAETASALESRGL